MDAGAGRVLMWIVVIMFIGFISSGGRNDHHRSHHAYVSEE